MTTKERTKRSRLLTKDEIDERITPEFEEFFDAEIKEGLKELDRGEVVRVELDIDNGTYRVV